MPIFTARKFRLPGSGSANSMTAFNKTLQIQEDNMSLHGGVSSGEYQKLIDIAIGMLSPSDNQDTRLSKEAKINTYRVAMEKIDNRFVEAPENIQLDMKNQFTSNMYINGEDPLVALEQKVRILDEAVFRYDNALVAKNRDNLPANDLMTERYQTVKQYEEFNRILKDVKENAETGGKRKLDGVAYVVTPGANGQVMNTEIVPSRFVTNQIRTNSYTKDGIPMYVVPNRTLPGRDQAVIGPYVFEETTGKMTGPEMRIERKRLMDEGFKGAELNNQMRLATESAEPMFQVKSFNGLPTSADLPLDLSSFDISPTLNEGEYGIGGSGIYTRRDGRLTLINATPGQFSLRPSEMKQLDPSLERMMKPEIQEVIDPTQVDPAAKDSFWDIMPPGSTLGPGVPPPQPQEEQPQEMPAPEKAPVGGPPTIKEPTGTRSFLQKATEMFRGQFRI